MSLPPDTMTSSAVPDQLRDAGGTLDGWGRSCAGGSAALLAARHPGVALLGAPVGSLARATLAAAAALRDAAEAFASADRVDDVLRIALAEAGYVEGRNETTKYGAWFGLDHNFWCAMFVSWVFAQAGVPLPAVTGPNGFAKVSTAWAYAAKHERLVWQPQAGDVFFIDHGKGRGHTGIVVSVDEETGTIVTIEGNTNAVGARNGTMVRSKTRPISSINRGFWRVLGDVTDEQRRPATAARAGRKPTLGHVRTTIRTTN
jgi:hypothetical protein